MPFDLGELRRHPDVEGHGLEASDAADRLILDEAAALAEGLGPGGLVVIDDAYGALALGSAAAGARGIRVHQDLVTGERALAANAERAGFAGDVRSLPLGARAARRGAGRAAAAAAIARPARRGGRARSPATRHPTSSWSRAGVSSTCRSR